MSRSRRARLIFSSVLVITVLLVTMSVITFFIGLISEQIALMRFERLQK